MSALLIIVKFVDALLPERMSKGRIKDTLQEGDFVIHTDIISYAALD